MSDITLQGFTVPSQPNYGVAVVDTDNIPEQMSYSNTSGDPAIEATPTQEAIEVAYAINAVANGPMRLQAIQSNGGDLRAIFSVPVGVAGVTPTNSSAKLAVSTPTVSNLPYEGTFIQAITRFLRRISKLNRGAN
jgi:hypothetical protein